MVGASVYLRDAGQEIAMAGGEDIVLTKDYHKMGFQKELKTGFFKSTKTIIHPRRHHDFFGAARDLRNFCASERC